MNPRKEKHKLEEMFDNLDDFVFLADATGHKLVVNQKMIETLGYSEEELFGPDPVSLHPTEDQEFAGALRREAVANGIARGEIRLVSKQGRIFETELLLSYSREDGTLQGVYRDVSERRRMERQLKERTRQLEVQHLKVMEATRERDRFFASVSHELRTPMTSIIGFTQLLLEDTEDPLTPAQQAQLEKVAQNAHRMLILINDLLDLAKLEAGKMEMNLGTVELPVLVTQVVDNMQPLLHHKPVRLITDLSPDLRRLTTDEQKLSQVLVNLISNAIKFTDEGQVTVSTRQDGRKVRISVADTGIGISSRDLGRIFDEFQQAENESRIRRAGTGLGLTIAQRLTGLLGGQLQVESKPGKGSVFTAVLPLDLKGQAPGTRIKIDSAQATRKSA